MSDVEPISLRPRPGGTTSLAASPVAQNHLSHPQYQPVCFSRAELNRILTVYGRKVAAGDWRDYALDFGKEKAVFSVFLRASEVPLYRIEKCPKLARRQGAYAVISAHGLILKRGHDLHRVLEVLDKSIRLVDR